MPRTPGVASGLLPGMVGRVSPSIGDIHEVANAFDDRVSISIHVYGANIGAVRRAVYDASTGAERPFVSGYANTLVPNRWDRSVSRLESTVFREAGLSSPSGRGVCDAPAYASRLVHPSHQRQAIYQESRPPRHLGRAIGESFQTGRVDTELLRPA